MASKESLPLVSHATSSVKINFRMYFIAVIHSLAPFLCGFHMAVANGALVGDTHNDGANGLIDHFDLSIVQQSLVTAIYLAGSTLGAIFGGRIADGLGRVHAARVVSIPFIIGTLMCASATDMYILCAGRLITGISGGMGMIVAPLALSEASPVKARGHFSTYPQLLLTIGILLAYLVAYLFRVGRVPASINTWRNLTAQETNNGWKLMFLSSLPVSLLYLFLSVFLVESPRWLVMRKSEEEARIALHKIRSSQDNTSKEFTFANLGSLSFLSTLSLYRKQAIVGIVLNVMQQASGIPAIFDTAGFEEPLLGSVALGVCNGSLYLGLSGTAAIAGVMFFDIGFAIGLGPIPWFLVTEMTPIEGRSTIQSTSTFFNWVSNAAITFSYLPFIILAIAGGGSDDDSKAEGAAFSFFIFAACVLFLLLFTIFVIPETKGRSVEENMATLRGRNLNPSPTPHQPSLAVV